MGNAGCAPDGDAGRDPDHLPGVPGDPGRDRLGARRAVRPRRQLRRGHHPADGAGADHPAPAGDQADPLDAQHAVAPAEDQTAPTEVQGEQAAPAGRDHEALPRERGESALGVLARPVAVPDPDRDVCRVAAPDLHARERGTGACGGRRDPPPDGQPALRERGDPAQGHRLPVDEHAVLRAPGRHRRRGSEDHRRQAHPAVDRLRGRLVLQDPLLHDLGADDREHLLPTTTDATRRAAGRHEPAATGPVQGHADPVRGAGGRVPLGAGRVLDDLEPLADRPAGRDASTRAHRPAGPGETPEEAEGRRTQGDHGQDDRRRGAGSSAA